MLKQCLAAGILIGGMAWCLAAAPPIDRQAVVARHNPVLHAFDVEAPLSVGNGQFAFTVDATGLQTFPEVYDKTLPLGTLSQWGWHSFPNPEGWSMGKFDHTPFDAHGRPVGYADIPGNRRTPEISWLRANPHRLHLGRIGFFLRTTTGQPARTNDLTEVEQRLDLWSGTLHSRFKLEGQMVTVETCSLPEDDGVLVRVRSSLVASGRLGFDLAFPYGTGAFTTADWARPEAHQTRQVSGSPGRADLLRTLDQDTYQVQAQWRPAFAKWEETKAHHYRLTASGTNEMLEFLCMFAPTRRTQPLADWGMLPGMVHGHWERFWRSGGAVDFSGSKDVRWRELERRVVLSQYLTAIQCAGTLPPQESGLTFNSWEGKFHLEMHWWHAAHFALWNRPQLLEKSLPYYQTILPQARATAGRQGYTGARWPKMTGPGGIESPSPVGPFLVWQQPHPIFYAELCYRAHRDRATLEKYREVVFETAEFMGSFVVEEQGGRRLVMGPPLHCAQETFPKERTFNPTFELTYWVWGLQVAQSWRERLGLPREAHWDRVLQRLSQPPIAADKYLFAESAPDSYTNPRWANDHPSVLMAYGFLPGPGIKPQIMRNTFAWVWQNWNWPHTWGWDYPMVALTAARLGEREKAVSALLMDTPKNVYRGNGHNHQRPGLTIYLPGNGGLLYAVAMMAAGWDGAGREVNPGFPKGEDWVVRWEGLSSAP